MVGLVLLCFGAVIVLLLVFINLPGIVENQAKKHLSGLVNSDQLEFDIERIGFSHFYMSNIRLASGISIDSMDVGYDIAGLSSAQLKTVKLSGLTIRARLDQNNQVSIQGLEFGKSSQDPGQSMDFRSLDPRFLPEKIVINSGKLVIEAFGQELSIPFDVLSTLDTATGRIVILTTMTPYGQQIRTQLRYQSDTGIEFIRLEGKSIDLALMNRFIAGKTDSVVFGGTSDIIVESLAPQKEWTLLVSKVSLVQPLGMALVQVAATVKINDKKMDVQGQFDFAFPMLPVIPVRYGATIDLKEDNAFKAQLETTRVQTIHIAHSSGDLTLKSPKLSVGLSGTPKKSKGNLAFGFDSGEFKMAGFKVNIPDSKTQTVFVSKTNLTSEITADFSALNPVTAVFKSMVNGLGAQSAMGDVKFAQCNVSGRVGVDKKHQPYGQFRVCASKGELDSSQYKVHASAIKFDLPIDFPDTRSRVSGTYAVPVILVQEKYQAGISGNIVQTGSKQFKVDGKADLKPLPGFLATYDATIGFEKDFGMVLDFTVDPFKISEKQIKQVMGPKLGNTVVAATVAVKGNAVVQGSKVLSRLEMNMTDGQVQMPDSHVTVTGIHTTIEMPDLLNPRSMPGQTMTIDSISVNDVKINDAILRFSIEDQHSFLVENLRFKWCNGLVSSEAVRFPQKDNIYQLTLYCDRLELSQLMQQLGAFHSDGDGTLNGRIPIVYSKGNISFNNGFLFSTPGSGGRVAIKNTGKLTAGIPLNTPQFSQLDLAQEALKDFNYTWAKLKLNTIGNTLAVAMELDGKPSKTLPFKYQKEFGGFIRVDASDPGSNFQGIKLDVNLNLPFNEVMEFGNKIQTLLKQ